MCLLAIDSGDWVKIAAIAFPFFSLCVTAWLTYKQALMAKDVTSVKNDVTSVKEDVTLVKEDVKKVEIATNSMKDALVKETKVSSLLQGAKDERARAIAEDGLIARGASEEKERASIAKDVVIVKEDVKEVKEDVKDVKTKIIEG